LRRYLKSPRKKGKGGARPTAWEKGDIENGRGQEKENPYLLKNDEQEINRKLLPTRSRNTKKA